MKPLLIQGGLIIDPKTGLEGEHDILIEDGTVRGVEKPGAFAAQRDAQVIDARGMWVSPGFMDIHVHFREPGQEWKETIATGARTAAAGGYTQVCCMPNTNPRNDCGSVAELVVKQAEAAKSCRVSPIGAISVGLKGQALTPMLELREAGCVAFSDDGEPVFDAGLMRRALEYCKMLGATLCCHEEEKSLCQGFSMNESALSLKLGLRGMPDAAENVMIARDIELARLTKARVHFCHVSTARGVTLIQRAKEDGIPVTAEVAPHHFTLDESAVKNFDTNAKMNPPLRSVEDVEAVLGALSKGIIDCVACDHAPHEADSKRKEFEAASFGIIGLQTNLPLILRRVREGKISRMRAFEALTTSPARCLGMTAPSLAKGATADLVIIDPKRVMKFDKSTNLSKSSNSPFMGWDLQGLAVSTMVGGREVFSIEDVSR